MTPLDAALSSFFCAALSASTLLSVPAAATAALVRVFNSERTALFATRAFSLVRMRFFWLLMFATGFLSLGKAGQTKLAGGSSYYPSRVARSPCPDPGASVGTRGRRSGRRADRGAR